MVSLSLKSNEVIAIGKYVPLAIASTASGYNGQYLRRLLRVNKLKGIKISRVWSVEARCLQAYLNTTQGTGDSRWGP